MEAIIKFVSSSSIAARVIHGKGARVQPWWPYFVRRAPTVSLPSCALLCPLLLSGHASVSSEEQKCLQQRGIPALLSAPCDAMIMQRQEVTVRSDQVLYCTVEHSLLPHTFSAIRKIYKNYRMGLRIPLTQICLLHSIRSADAVNIKKLH